MRETKNVRVHIWNVAALRALAHLKQKDVLVELRMTSVTPPPMQRERYAIGRRGPGEYVGGRMGGHRHHKTNYHSMGPLHLSLSTHHSQHVCERDLIGLLPTLVVMIPFYIQGIFSVHILFFSPDIGRCRASGFYSVGTIERR